MRRVFFCLLISVWLLAACGGGQTASQSSPPPTGVPSSSATLLPPTPIPPTPTPQAPAAMAVAPSDTPPLPTAGPSPTQVPSLAPAPCTASRDLDTAGMTPAAAGLASSLEGLSLEQFYDASWRALMLRDPEGVVGAGMADALGLSEVALTDLSTSYRCETYQMVAVVLDLLERYDRSALTPEEQISFDTYQWLLEDWLAEQEFMYHDYPATYLLFTSKHKLLLDFFATSHPVQDMQDARDYVTRLGLVGTKIDQLLEGLKQREAAGIVPPKFAIDWEVQGDLAGLVASPARQTPFYTALQEKVYALDGASDAERLAVLKDAEAAIDDVVLPAYRELRGYLAGVETYPGADGGVERLPGGAAYYTYLLRHHTTTDLTADEIHQLGLAELERIHAEMRLVFDQLGYPQGKGESLARLYGRVADDGGRVAGNEVLATFERLLAEADQRLEAAFDIRPKAELIVAPTDAGTNYYSPGSLDGSRPGVFYAAVGGASDYYRMPCIAYHEAIPGHHFQVALAQETTDLPRFRRDASFNGYVEGWALYAERLAWELGWYEGDPYGYLGYLQLQAYRAARLVVDTGLHAKGWTSGQAEAFFVENVGYSPGAARYEIARYLVYPGQATSYHVGYLRIMDLRQKAVEQLGDRFDLKEFQRVILTSGAVPLEILERIVDGYITATLAGG